MSTEVSWRFELSRRLKKKGDLLHLANQLGVMPRTLKRWIDRTSNPQWEEIKVIVNTFPELAPLLFQEFLAEHPMVLPRHSPENRTHVEPENYLPGSFYAEIMQIVSTQPDYFHTVSKKLLRFAIQTLDQDQAGVKIVIAICMPPDEQASRVQSLLVRAEMATPPFDPTTLHEPNLFLGAESLAGSAILKQHWEAIQLGGTETSLPLDLFPAGTKVVAVPMLRWGQGVAGCILFGSTASLNISILQQITNLFGLTFPDHYFFSQEHIGLEILPNWSTQRLHCTNFRDRTEKIQQTRGANLLAAEGVVRKQIEIELINWEKKTA